MAAREAVRITKEVTWGVYQTTPPSTDVAVLHLPAGDSQTIRATPQLWTERSAGSNNRRVMRGTERTAVGGSLTTKAFPSQAKVIIPLAISLSGTQLDLGSFTVDHRILKDDGSGFDYRRYLGCKASSLNLTCDNTEGGTVVQIALDCVGKAPATITVTDFAEPAFGVSPGYPFEDPFAFEDLTGLLSIAGSPLPFFSSMNFKVDNKLRNPFDDKRYISQLTWAGRDASMVARSRYTTSSWRTILEAQTAEPITFTFSDGTNTAAFDMKGANYADSVADSLPFEGDGFYQTLTWANFFDTTAGTDLAFVESP